MDQPQDKQSTNVVDFTQKFKTIKELQDYARAQFLTLLQANRRIEHLETENRDLKAQIETMKSLEVSSNKTELLSRSDEQDLCEIEIKRLKDAAMAGPLTLEETKRLDLLVKNLYLAKGKPHTLLNGKHRKLGKISEAELVQIASSSDPESD